MTSVKKKTKRYFTSAMEDGYTVFDNKEGTVVKRFPYSKDEEFSKKAKKKAYKFTKNLNLKHITNL